MGQQQADQQQGQVEIRGESSSSKEQQASNSSSSAIACEDSQQLQQCRVRASQHPAMSLEAAAVHALCAGAGWLAVKVGTPGAPATQEVEVQELTAKLAALQARLEQVRVQQAGIFSSRVLIVYLFVPWSMKLKRRRHACLKQDIALIVYFLLQMGAEQEVGWSSLYLVRLQGHFKRPTALYPGCLGT
eukprot:scaffold168462_cov25-Tisochrysis_lutea.AAC.1